MKLHVQMKNFSASRLPIETDGENIVTTEF